MQSAYFNAFVLAMIVCWSPFKALAYMVPFVVVFWIASAAGGCKIRRRPVQWFAAWLRALLPSSAQAIS